MEVEWDIWLFENWDVEIWLFGHVFENPFLLWAVVESDLFVTLLWLVFFVTLSWQVNQFFDGDEYQEVFEFGSANGTSSRRLVK